MEFELASSIRTFFVTLGKSIVVKLLPLGLLSSWALAVRYCQGTTGMKSPRSLNLNVTATNLSLNAPTNPLFGALKETALSSFAPIDPKSKNYTDTNTNIYDMNSGRGGSVQKVPTLEFSGSFSSSSLFISALAILRDVGSGSPSSICTTVPLVT